MDILNLRPTVEAIAKKLAFRLPKTVDLEDLIAEGWLGAIDAQKRFDPGRGVTFQSFAKRRICGAMLDFLREIDPLSRTHRRGVKNGSVSAPTIIELDAPVPNREEGRQIADGRHDDVVKYAIAQELLGCLSGRQRRFVERYFFEGLRMHEIGYLEDINESRVSQIIAAALKVMRDGVRITRVSTKPVLVTHQCEIQRDAHDQSDGQRVRHSICRKREQKAHDRIGKREMKQLIRIALSVPGATIRSIAGKSSAPSVRNISR